MKYDYKPTRMAKIKTLAISRTGKDVEKMESLHIAGGSLRWHGLFGKQCGNFLKS